MMGRKERTFGPLPSGSREDLVPPQHFYRYLEQSLDLSFVRDLVHETYAHSGRPSIDPVVFFTFTPRHELLDTYVHSPLAEH